MCMTIGELIHVTLFMQIYFCMAANTLMIQYVGEHGVGQEFVLLVLSSSCIFLCVKYLENKTDLDQNTYSNVNRGLSPKLTKVFIGT